MTAENNYDNYPLKNIAEPGSNDVMCGRGGGTNNHAGNIKFRQLVNEHKLRYLAATKVDKPKVARDVVQIWRAQTPPGRFLTKSSAETASKSKEILWHDVGDQKAREKASQCLRERTPDVMPFVQHLQNQENNKKNSRLDKKNKSSTNSSSNNNNSAQIHPDQIHSNNNGVGLPNAMGLDLHNKGSVDSHLQQLQQLHELQQQQIQQLQMIQQHLAAGLNPNMLMQQQQTQQQSPEMNRLTLDPAAAAAALLDPNTSDAVVQALRKANNQQAQSLIAKNGDEVSIDEDASVGAIATALFGRKPDPSLSGGGFVVSAQQNQDRLYSSAANLNDYKPDINLSNAAAIANNRCQSMPAVTGGKFIDFQMGDDQFPQDDGDLQSLKMDDMSKSSWVQDFQSITSASMADVDDHSLGKIGGGTPVESTNRRQNMASNKGINSKMSMISELTDYDNAAAGEKQKSSRSMASRARKMAEAKNLNSNISMLSELTDMTGEFSALSLKK